MVSYYNDASHDHDDVKMKLFALSLEDDVEEWYFDLDDDSYKTLSEFLEGFKKKWGEKKEPRHLLASSTLCEYNVIQMQHLVHYTPQQNGVAESKNRALKEMVTCMLEAKYLSPKLCDEAINCAEYVRNIFPRKALEEKTPFEAWNGHKPNVSHFRVFGSKAWAKIPLEKNNHLTQYGKNPCKKSSSLCKTMKLGSWFLYLPRGN